MNIDDVASLQSIINTWKVSARSRIRTAEDSASADQLVSANRCLMNGATIYANCMQDIQEIIDKAYAQIAIDSYTAKAMGNPIPQADYILR